MKKNVVTIKITGYASHMRINSITGIESNEQTKAIKLKHELEFIVKLRTARKIGDIETINHTMLGKLKDSGIPFEILG